MVSTRQQKVIFESSCALARDVLIAPAEFVEMGQLTYEIHSQLKALQDWSFYHCDQSKNSIAQDLALSVTSDRRYHSYIARGGPSWLLQRIEREASP
ncbi:hypothetical protein Bca4012_039667 [Brassica carinata]